MHTWNVSLIVDLVGGVADLRRLLARTGQDVPDSSAVSMWKTRNRLPTQWTAPVVYALMTRDPKLDLRTLMVRMPSLLDFDATAPETDEASTPDPFGGGSAPA